MSDPATDARLHAALRWGTVLLGVALRIAQFAANPSLWIDELALALPIVTRDLPTLLTVPLPAQQMAPPGLLALEWLVVRGAGAAPTHAAGAAPADAALRLVPLLGSIAALVVFAVLAPRILDRAAAWLATFLVATGIPFIVWGSTLKQYSTDVAIAVVLTAIALRLLEPAAGPKDRALAAGAGAVLVWFSQPAVLVLAGAGAVLLLAPGTPDPRATRRWLAPVVAVWALACTAAAAFALGHATAPMVSYVQRFWASGFPPEGLRAALAAKWPWPSFVQLFGTGPSASLEYRYPAAWAAAALAGFGVLALRRRTAALVLGAPILLTLAAAALRRYPFSDRLVLFIVPALLLALAATVEVGARALSRLHPAAGAGLVVAVAACSLPALARTPPPYQREDTKPAFAYVRERWRPGDIAYVYYGAAPVTAFYAADVGLGRGDYVVGGCHRGVTREYLREVDAFRGHPRLWIFIAHAIPFYGEDVDLLAYLEAIGERRGALQVASRLPGAQAPPSAVYLYDLSDPTRLARSDADSQLLDRARALDPRLTCDEGPQSLIASDFPLVR